MIMMFEDGVDFICVVSQQQHPQQNASTRLEDARRIEKTIGELGTMFVKMAGLVKAQAEVRQRSNGHSPESPTVCVECTRQLKIYRHSTWEVPSASWAPCSSRWRAWSTHQAEVRGAVYPKLSLFVGRREACLDKVFRDLESH
jgi:hypothetical protein